MEVQEVLAERTEEAELDAQPPVVLQIRVEELVHFGHPLCCSEEAHQREWRVHVVKVSGSRMVKDAVLLVKRRAVREQEARKRLQQQGKDSSEAITLSSSDEETEEVADEAGTFSFALDDDKIFFGREAKDAKELAASFA